MLITHAETTADQGTHPPGSSPTRSRRRRALPIIVVLAVAALIAGAVWFSAYQPLSSTNGGYGAGFTAGGGYDSVVIDNAFGQERRIVEPQAGDEIAMLFPLENGGPLGITIVSVAQPFNPTGTVGSGSRPDETSAARATRATDPAESEYVELTPFALPAGGRASIRLTFDVLDCATISTSGQINTATTVPVTIRVLGVTRTVDVPLPYAISIESLPHCPD